MKKYTVLDGDGFNCGDYDDLDEAIAYADEMCGNPDSPESRRARARRQGNAVYAVRSDVHDGEAQVNQNF